MRRLAVPTRFRGSVMSLPLLCLQRNVHERGFTLPDDPGKGEAFEVARDALLQLNIMTRRGIEPDTLMYTSLIQTMGRAGLEWQAYKLFSRMIESNVRPLPETYVALRDATSKHRRALRSQIDTRIEEAVRFLPEQLAEAEEQRMQEEGRLCIAKYEEYLRGELPPPRVELAVAPSEGSGPTSSSPSKAANAASVSAPVATMHIRNLADAWNTAAVADATRGGFHNAKASEASRLELQKRLEGLHEEELGIFLSAQRQLRGGSKEELVKRILATVGEHAIRSMLSRRNHYFRSVEKLLAADLAKLQAEGDPTDSSKKDFHWGEKDRTLSRVEAETAAPDVLHTPWGILRKPFRVQATEGPSVSNASVERLEQVRLSGPELHLVAVKAATGDLDELPEALLRRYAFQHRLRWRRREPGSLLSAVQWHATTFLPAQAVEVDGKLASAQPAPTPALRLATEDAGMQRTLETFEAFRVISQRTNNLQVVDDKEINLHLKRIRREAAAQERKTVEALRREQNIMAAAGLAAIARQFTVPKIEEPGTTRILGLSMGRDHSRRLEGEPTEAIAPPAPHSPSASNIRTDMPDELPPWALFGGEEEFNLTTGSFGDPHMGRYQELSDSQVRLLPSREAQKKWSVDRHLLPTPLREATETAELQETGRVEAVEAEYTRRQQYARYRKWDRFISKAQSKSRAAREAIGKGRPIPPKLRLSQLLRKGRERAAVSEEMRVRFAKEL